MTAEDLLARTFVDVTETTDYPITSMATIEALAASRRRARRRATTLVAAATVVLVGLSATLWVHRPQDSVPTPLGPLPQLAQGPAPRIDYVDGDTFITTSGVRLTSPALRRAEQMTAYGDGVLVNRTSSPRHPLTTLSVVSGEAPVQRLGCGSTTLAAGPTRDAPAYWLSDTCRERPDPLHLTGGRLHLGTASTVTPPGSAYFPVGWLADGVVAQLSGVTPSGSSVRHLVVVAPDGSERPIPHLLLTRGVSRGANVVSGLVHDLQTSAVVDASTGRVLWRRAHWTISSFSTSGRYVVGTQSVGVQTVPGLGDVVGVMEAATGRPVVTTVLKDLTILGQPVWEGDSSLLVVAEDRDHQQAIVRVDLDGAVTRATRVAPASHRAVSTFRLAATP